MSRFRWYRRRFIVVVVVAFLLLTALPPTAASAVAMQNAVIHVASDGHDDDRGDGSFGRPYRSIKRAADDASPGSRIMLRGGEYALTQSQTVTLTGTAAKPIVITNYNHVQPILDGTGIATRGNYDNPILKLSNSSHVIVQGLTVRNSQSRGIDASESNYITIRNNIVEDIASRAIGGASDNLTIENNIIRRVVLENKFGELDPDVQNWAAAISTWRRYGGEPVKNLIVRNNDVSEVWGEGIIALFVVGGEITGNSVRDTYSVNIYVDRSTDVRVDRNFMRSTSRVFDRSSRPATGISMANEYYELVPNRDPSRDPIVPPSLNRITITNNLLLDTGDGIRFWFDARNTERLNTYKNVTIANNTLHDYIGRGISAAAVGNADAPANIKIANNSVGAPMPGRPALNVGNPGGWSFSNNNWVGGLPPQGTHPGSLSANPNYVNARGGSPADFKLTSSSPNVGAGARTNAPPIDYFGTQRGTVPSIGFHERSAVTPGARVNVRALGTTGAEEIAIEVDGARIATRRLGTSMQTYSLQASTAAPGRIDVRFLNDGLTNGVDRNVRVDYIEVDGVRYQTEASSTFSTGTWSSSNGCGDGYKQNELLHCNGYFRYELRGATINVRARGTTGTELVTVTVDGVAAGTRRLAPSMQTWTVATSTAAPSKVQVAFTNNGRNNGVKRDVVVDYIEFDGVRYQTEAPATLSTGTWSISNGCAAGYKRSETLNCNGYFEYRLR